MGSIVAEIRERSDHQGSDFVTDDELAGWVNQSAADLHDLIVDYAGPEAVQHSADLTLVAGEDTIELPPDYYRLVGVDALFGGRWLPLRPYAPRQRRRFQPGPGWSGPRDAQYRLVGRKDPAAWGAATALMSFVPRAPRDVQITVWYIPLAFHAAKGGDQQICQGLCPHPLLTTWNGWDEYVISDVCAKIQEKREGDPRPFAVRRDRARARIISAAVAFDTGEPARIRDAREEYGGDPYDLLRYS